ncbi:unnamed protein product [Macrosiphum euphorbiae]|uniref:Uncharacterized protein n=1 Tax=Macrosiphum euphorbiae TaxID=13131 RepID=A0AAV0XK70_9HEMI|nr:unnamed protein product [Macrosiphum euphorbiae]
MILLDPTPKNMRHNEKGRSSHLATILCIWCGTSLTARYISTGCTTHEKERSELGMSIGCCPTTFLSNH